MHPSIAHFYNFINRFHTVSEEEFDLLTPHFVMASVHKKEMLLREGQVRKTLLFVNKGLLRVFRNEDGKEVTVGFLKDTDFFFDFESFFHQQASVLNIDCLESTEYVQLPYQRLLDAYDHSHGLERIGRLMVERAFLENIRINSAAKKMQPVERYIAFEKENPKLVNRIPLKVLASFIGITPESLSRIRKRRMELS